MHKKSLFLLLSCVSLLSAMDIIPLEQEQITTEENLHRKCIKTIQSLEQRLKEVTEQTNQVDIKLTLVQEYAPELIAVAGIAGFAAGLGMKPMCREFYFWYDMIINGNRWP